MSCWYVYSHGVHAEREACRFPEIECTSIWSVEHPVLLLVLVVSIYSCGIQCRTAGRAVSCRRGSFVAHADARVVEATPPRVGHMLDRDVQIRGVGCLPLHRPAVMGNGASSTRTKIEAIWRRQRSVDQVDKCSTLALKQRRSGINRVQFIHLRVRSGTPCLRGPESQQCAVRS